MRLPILILSFILVLKLNSQSFYEKIMDMNITIADTSNDPEILRQSASAFDRLLKSSPNDWPIAYHHTLCYTRMADLLLKDDTAFAKSNYFLAKESFKRTDTLDVKQPENKILALYLKIIELRFDKEKTRITKLKLLESEIITLKKASPSNPRLSSVYGYFYLTFYNTDKIKKTKSVELFKDACKHYGDQKSAGYYPRWGKKWNDELLLKLNIKSCVNRSGQK